VDVLTSGSAILALSFALPVILPKLGCLPELVTEEESILFDPSERDSLRTAMKTIRTRNLEEMSARAFARAREMDWDGIARSVSVLYT